jgi:hypothetical protein
MHTDRQVRPTFPPYPEESPSLPTVLSAMGHHCRGLCPPEAQQLSAVWFVARGRQVGSVGLIVVDLSEANDDASIDWADVIAHVDQCARHDRIRVRPRPANPPVPTKDQTRRLTARSQ